MSDVFKHRDYFFIIHTVGADNACVSDFLTVDFIFRADDRALFHAVRFVLADSHRKLHIVAAFDKVCQSFGTADNRQKLFRVARIADFGIIQHFQRAFGINLSGLFLIVLCKYVDDFFENRPETFNFFFDDFVGFQNFFYDAVLRRLESHGYERYEISNFARDGYESRHNLAYWLRTPYLGLGAAAYSFVNGARFSNEPDVSEYVRSVEQGVIPERNREVLTASDEKEETIMLSLRTKYGMNLNEYNEKFHADFLTEKAAALQKNAEFLIISNNNITINKDYFYISNAIISDLI